MGKTHHLVGMSVREPGGAAGELQPEVYHALLAHAADFIVDRFDADVLFVSMERQDIGEAHRVIGLMAFPERAAVLRGQYPPGELLGLMSHFDIAVGMRLHFLIFLRWQGDRAARGARDAGYRRGPASSNGAADREHRQDVGPA